MLSCERRSVVTTSRREYGEIGAASRWRARRRTRAAWIVACVAPGLLVQALESRGAAQETPLAVRIGQSYQLKIGVSVDCRKSSCDASQRVDAVDETRIADVPVILDIVPEPGVAASEPLQLPFTVGRSFIPPISGWISLDFRRQAGAKKQIETRGAPECDSVEVLDIRLEDVLPHE